MHLRQKAMTMRSETRRADAIDRLLDRAELEELAARYARAVDRGDRELLLSLYHADAIDHHGNDFRGNPAQFADYVQGATAVFEVTAHYILNSSYEIEGDRADGELYFVAYHRMPPPEPNEIVVAGRYLDRYERRDGAWKIVYRSIVWDWASASQMTAQALQLLRDRGDGGGKADDVSRAALPLLARRI
jgi:hypothetical protein